MFLSFVNFYKRFIHNYLRIVTLLINLLKESKNNKEVKSFVEFNKICKLFINFVISLYRFYFFVITILIKKIKIKIDAFSFAIASILK